MLFLVFSMVFNATWQFHFFLYLLLFLGVFLFLRKDESWRIIWLLLTASWLVFGWINRIFIPISTVLIFIVLLTHIHRAHTLNIQSKFQRQLIFSRLVSHLFLRSFLTVTIIKPIRLVGRKRLLSLLIYFFWENNSLFTVLRRLILFLYKRDNILLWLVLLLMKELLLRKREFLL